MQNILLAQARNLAPLTGDKTGRWILIMIAALVVLVAFLVWEKITNKKDDEEDQ